MRPALQAHTPHNARRDEFYSDPHELAGVSWRCSCGANGHAHQPGARLAIQVQVAMHAPGGRPWAYSYHIMEDGPAWPHAHD